MQAVGARTPKVSKDSPLEAGPEAVKAFGSGAKCGLCDVV